MVLCVFYSLVIF